MPLAAAPAGVTVEQLGPRNAEEQDRRVARLVREIVDELEEGGLRPLQVVEDDDEWPAPSESLEELADGPEGLLADGGA